MSRERKGLVSRVCLQHKILGYVLQLHLFVCTLFYLECIFGGDLEKLTKIMGVFSALSHPLELLLMCSISTLWLHKHFESVSEAHILGKTNSDKEYLSLWSLVLSVCLKRNSCLTLFSGGLWFFSIYCFNPAVIYFCI
uniref:Uncharacterized protein n=1 Tax=Molossus molossus TaxID=27622 RepID=A0A7J8DTH0_MOLMO|nr:hypothetical protein HJG59_009137 [Molossus molossus]